MIEDYSQEIDALINQSALVHSSSITYDKRSTFVGSIRAEVFFLDGSRLHFREFINVQHDLDRYMYVYHYQRSDGTLSFRYDNAPHFPALRTFPHHKHDGDELNVVSASPSDLLGVLTEIETLIDYITA